MEKAWNFFRCQHGKLIVSKEIDKREATKKMKTRNSMILTASFEEVDRMTMSEFELRMIAFNLAEVDEERKRHELAYLNVKAQATNKKGKPVFESFKSFYDYEKRVAEVLAANQPQRTKLNERKKTQLATVAERLRRYREGRRVDGE